MLEESLRLGWSGKLGKGRNNRSCLLLNMYILECFRDTPMLWMSRHNTRTLLGIRVNSNLYIVYPYAYDSASLSISWYLGMFSSTPALLEVLIEQRMTLYFLVFQVRSIEIVSLWRSKAERSLCLVGRSPFPSSSTTIILSIVTRQSIRSRQSHDTKPHRSRRLCLHPGYEWRRRQSTC